jgi:2-isopropylmalate synthase
VICALTRAVEKDIDVAADALKYARKKRIHTGIGTSPYHIKYKFKSTPEEIIERAIFAVKYAKKYVEDIEFYAEDAGRTDNEYLAKVLKLYKGRGHSCQYPRHYRILPSRGIRQKINYLVENVKGLKKP